MKNFKNSFLLVCLLSVSTVFAQLDSVHKLSTVETSTVRITHFSSTSKIQVIDSTKLNAYSNNNLADLLSNESMVFVKSYGLGSLATSSFRGAGASHTAILWNGFNLQSPMHGLIDLSLIPTNFTNSVKLQYGSSSALWGSGAVGGAIHLNNTNSFNKGISVITNTSFGSFSDKQQQLTLEISKKKFVSSIKLFNHDAENNFEFINRAQYGKPKQNQTNAELKQYGLLQENYFQLTKTQQLNTRFWYQFNYRNIPPSMTQNMNVANQRDESYRITSEWQQQKKKYSLNARVAYFDEKLFYDDSLIQLNSKSHSQNIIAEVESKFKLTRFDNVNIGVNNTNSIANTKDYIQKHQQNRFSIFGSYRLHTQNYNWNAVLNLRQEIIENKSAPFTFSFGIDGKILKHFFIKANVAQHYRIPTFNDLYWAQGGNPDLKPESGISEDVSISYKYALRKFSWELEAAAFNRDINNWIIWLPNQYGIWSPDNVLKVWSRGLEYKLKLNYKFNKFKIELSGLYNYVLSTNIKSNSSGDASLNKQLIYVPIQNAQGSLMINYAGFSLYYNQTYIGYRYTTSDNKQYLKPYTISNVQLAYIIPLAESKIKIYAQLNNLFNENYEVIAYRPMPLFNYQVGLALYFNEKNKQLNQ